MTTENDLPSPEVIHEWLQKLDDAGINPWTLLYAHVALSAVEEAANTKAEDPDIGDDWGWYDELCSAADAERDDPSDGISIFYSSAIEMGEHLGFKVPEGD